MSKAREDAKVASEEEFKFEADYVTELRRRRDEVGDFTNSYVNNLTQLLLSPSS